MKDISNHRLEYDIKKRKRKTSTCFTQSDCSLNSSLLSGPQKPASEAQFTSVMTAEQGSLRSRRQPTGTRDGSHPTDDHRQ